MKNTSDYFIINIICFLFGLNPIFAYPGTFLAPPIEDLEGLIFQLGLSENEMETASIEQIKRALYLCSPERFDKRNINAGANPQRGLNGNRRNEEKLALWDFSNPLNGFTSPFDFSMEMPFQIIVHGLNDNCNSYPLTNKFIENLSSLGEEGFLISASLINQDKRNIFKQIEDVNSGVILEVPPANIFASNFRDLQRGHSGRKGNKNEWDLNEAFGIQSPQELLMATDSEVLNWGWNEIAIKGSVGSSKVAVSAQFIVTDMKGSPLPYLLKNKRLIQLLNNCKVQGLPILPLPFKDNRKLFQVALLRGKAKLTTYMFDNLSSFGLGIEEKILRDNDLIGTIISSGAFGTLGEIEWIRAILKRGGNKNSIIHYQNAENKRDEHLIEYFLRQHYPAQKKFVGELLAHFTLDELSAPPYGPHIIDQINKISELEQANYR